MDDNVKVVLRVRPFAEEDARKESIISLTTRESLMVKLPRSTQPTPLSAAAVMGTPKRGGAPSSSSDMCQTPQRTPRRKSRGHRRTVSSPSRFQEYGNPATPAKQQPGGLEYECSTKFFAERQFTFDRVFGERASQDDVYDVVAPYVHSVIRDGYNATIMAYGQTGSGKTHTMMGVLGGDGQEGIVPRAIRALYAYIESAPDTQFLVDVSFVELYRESFFDLLEEDVEGGAKIAVREDKNKAPFLAKGTGPGSVRLREPVSDQEHMFRMLEEGRERRTVVSTLMNSSSSRSHAIFSVYIESRSGASGTGGAVSSSVLHLIDLAGSERIKLSGVTGTAAKEASAINKSLSALGNVLSALSKPGSGSRRVPYRDSKLTHFLRDSLGGSAKTLIVANIRQDAEFAHQTKTVLGWAARARKIRNRPIAHTDVEESRIAALEAAMAAQEAKFRARIAEMEGLLASQCETSLDMASESFVAALDEMEAERARESAERAAVEKQMSYLMHSHATALDKQEAKVQELERALRAESQRSSTLKSDLAASQAKADAALKELQSVTESLHMNKAESEDHAAKIQALTKQWCELAERESSALKSKLKKYKSAAFSLKSKVGDLASRLEATESRAQAAEARAEAAEARAAAAFAQIARLLDSTNKSQAAKDARVSELEAQNARLVAQLERDSKDVLDNSTTTVTAVLGDATNNAYVL